MSPRIAFRVVGLLMCMLCLPRPALASENWSPESPLHAELLKAYAQDLDVFPTSSGVVRQSLASPASLVSFLGRNGVQVDTPTAEVLALHIELVMKGRAPRDVEVQRLVTAFKPGSRGLHGHIAEIDLAKTNPEARFSSDGSQSTDLTFRGSDGRVLAYGQLKCSESADRSLKGVIEDYICFHRHDWAGKSSVPYRGYIPMDQFDQLRRDGVIDADGRFSDPRGVDSRVREVMSDLSGYGSRNRDALQAGANRLALGEDVRSPILIKPLPESRETYLQRASAQNREYSSPKALRAAATSRPTFARGAAALAIGAFEGLNSRSPADVGLSASATVLGIAELGMPIKRVEMARTQRMLRKIPGWMRPELPKLSSMRSVGRLAVCIQIAIAGAFVGWDIYQYSNGSMTTRQFSRSMAQNGGGLGGALGGGWVGGQLGAGIGGPFAIFTAAAGAAVGATLGAFIGSFVGGEVNDAVWASFDERELNMALELIRDKCRGLDP